MEDWLASKRTFGIMLELIGVGLIGLAFKIQADNNAHNATGAYLGRAAEGTTGPYIVGAAGVAAIVIGWLVARSEAKANRISAGWHDDPESPDLLRYHDGQGWTDRTAAKG